MFIRRFLKLLFFFICFSKSPSALNNPQKEISYLNGGNHQPYSSMDEIDQQVVEDVNNDNQLIVRQTVGRGSQAINGSEFWSFGCRILSADNFKRIREQLELINFNIFNLIMNQENLIIQCFQEIAELQQTHVQIICGLMLIRYSLIYISDYYYRTLVDSFLLSYRNDSAIFRSNEQASRLYDDLYNNYSRNLSMNSYDLFGQMNVNDIFPKPVENMCLLCHKIKNANNAACSCSFDERESGIPYENNSRLVLGYSRQTDFLVSNIFQEIGIDVLGYGYDVFGEIFIAFRRNQTSGLHDYYFCPISPIKACFRMIFFDQRVYCIFPNCINNEGNYYYCFLSNEEIQISQKKFSFKRINLDLFSDRMKLWCKNPCFLPYLFGVTLCTAIFFSLFCVNWSNNCDNCGHPAVKFFGGFFNFLFGNLFGFLLSDAVLNPNLFFKNIIDYDNYVSRYVVSFSKSKHCSIINYVRNKKIGAVYFNMLYFCGSLVIAGALFIWSFVWYVAILATDHSLINGLSFFAGLSLLVSGALVAADLNYFYSYKKNKEILRYDA